MTNTNIPPRRAKQRTQAPGALQQWWSERRAKIPRTFGRTVCETDKHGETTCRFSYDALHHAACLEASALDFDAAGFPDVADSAREQAVDVICSAAVAKEKAARARGAVA